MEKDEGKYYLCFTVLLYCFQYSCNINHDDMYVISVGKEDKWTGYKNRRANNFNFAIKG